MSSPPDKRTPIFVYGTLKRGDCRHQSIAHQEFVGTAKTTCSYRLLNLGDYPGLLKSADGVSVEGELYLVDDRCLRMLDEIEGVDEGLYKRARIQLLPPFDAIAAEAYFYLRDVSRAQDIGSCWRVRS